MAHTHLSHDPRNRDSERRRLLFALLVTGGIMVAEAVGGWISNSLALLSDAGHMFADVTALAISAVALWIATRPADSKRTYGYHRLEILGALANGVLLTVMALFIVMEGVRRLRHPEPIDATMVMVVGSIGLTANVLAILLLSRHRSGVATRGALFHVMGDTISSVGVIVGALVIQYTGWFIVDACLSFGIAAIIVYASFRLVRECVDVLLQGVPLGMELVHVRKELEAIPGVLQVHDIHIWTITSGMYTFSCHVKVTGNPSQEECDCILTSVKTMLAERFQIQHSTIQIESEEWQEVGHTH